MAMKNAATANNRRSTFHHNVHHMRGGKMTPVHFDVVREGEGGTYSVSISQELAPMPVRLLNNFTSGVVSVFVPLPAILYQRFGDTDDMAGTAEYARRALTSGTSVFALGNGDVDVAKVARIVPRMVLGSPKISSSVAFAHASAINFLRQRKYVDIDTIDVGTGQFAITPCLFSDSVLDRLGGVLDPDDRIGGTVDFDTEVTMTGELDIHDLFGLQTTNNDQLPALNSADSDYTPTNNTAGEWQEVRATVDRLPFVDVSEGAAAATAGAMSLRDFYQSEKKESITRVMRELIDSNPQYGEEIALRWAAGLSVNVGAQPFVLYESEVDFGTVYQQGVESDGIYDGGTKGLQTFNYTVPVPKTEFGGIIVTFTYVKPDEAISNQPHPYLTEAWTGQNFAADQLKVDPVPVTAADVDSTVDIADEDNRVMYTGYNGLKREYASYGWSRDTDLENVAEKSALWQIDVPMSLTPENMIYPNDISHYPFADSDGHAVTVSARCALKLATPTVFGPMPTETVGIIDDEGILDVSE